MILFFIGHSHTGMLRRAAKSFDTETVAHLRFRQREVDEPMARAKIAEVLSISADFDAQDLAVAAKARDVRFVLCVGGNAHFYLAHRELTPPIDFVHAPYSNEVDSSRHFVPRVHVDRLINWRLDRQFSALPFLRFPTERTLAVSSPPPAADNAFIASALATRLELDASEIAVAPPRLRLAAWDINRALTKKRFDETGISFFDPPPTTTDQNGFLRRRGHVETNSTHTNVWYGRQVLRALTFDDGFTLSEEQQSP